MSKTYIAPSVWSLLVVCAVSAHPTHASPPGAAAASKIAGSVNALSKALGSAVQGMCTPADIARVEKQIESTAPAAMTTGATASINSAYGSERAGWDSEIKSDWCDGEKAAYTSLRKGCFIKFKNHCNSPSDLDFTLGNAAPSVQITRVDVKGKNITISWKLSWLSKGAFSRKLIFEKGRDKVWPLSGCRWHDWLAPNARMSGGNWSVSLAGTATGVYESSTWKLVKVSPDDGSYSASVDFEGCHDILSIFPVCINVGKMAKSKIQSGTRKLAISAVTKAFESSKGKWDYGCTP